MDSEINFNLPIDQFNLQIKKMYKDYIWPKPKIFNACNTNVNSIKESQKQELLGESTKTTKTSFKPNFTQSFVSEYFSPENPNGLFLYHSVGSGKTISGLLLAKKYQELGYSIIWVTRTTLRKDIQKGLDYVSLLFPIHAISYKQFSNICQESGDNYEKIAKIKGIKDPFNRTLIIIDEAHKLYAQGELKAGNEQHDINVIEKMIFNSYNVSKENSLKLVLMTATPITDNFMDLIKLMNLIIENHKMRFTINKKRFQQIYFDNNGNFTKDGQKLFQEQIKGLISYIDMSNDPSKFAQVNYHEILVPISMPENALTPKEQKQQCNNNFKLCTSLNFNGINCKEEQTKCLDKVKNYAKNNKSQIEYIAEKCKYTFKE